MSEEMYNFDDISKTIKDAFFVRGYPDIYVVLLPFDFKSGIFYVVIGDDVTLTLLEKGNYELVGDTLSLVLDNKRPIYLKMKKVVRKKD